MRLREEPLDYGEHVIEYGVDPRLKFQLHRVVPIRSRRASALVYIDGQYYCGFVDEESARTAVAMWKGDQDGIGRLTTTHHGAAWPAVEGRRVEIVRG